MTSADSLAAVSSEACTDPDRLMLQTQKVLSCQYRMHVWLTAAHLHLTGIPSIEEDGCCGVRPVSGHPWGRRDPLQLPGRLRGHPQFQ